MTKKVRVEDADTNTTQKLKVKMFQRSNSTDAPDTLVSESDLSGPTDLREFHISASTYLVVEEVQPA